VHRDVKLFPTAIIPIKNSSTFWWI